MRFLVPGLEDLESLLPLFPFLQDRRTLDSCVTGTLKISIPDLSARLICKSLHNWMVRFQVKILRQSGDDGNVDVYLRNCSASRLHSRADLISSGLHSTSLSTTSSFSTNILFSSVRYESTESLDSAKDSSRDSFSVCMSRSFLQLCASTSRSFTCQKIATKKTAAI